LNTDHCELWEVVTWAFVKMQKNLFPQALVALAMQFEIYNVGDVKRCYLI